MYLKAERPVLSLIGFRGVEGQGCTECSSHRYPEAGIRNQHGWIQERRMDLWIEKGKRSGFRSSHKRSHKLAN